MTARDLTTLPVFGREYADCHTCELSPQCDRGLMCHSYRPKKFNGMMVIGEGPGHHEVAAGKPFVGKSGELLRALMRSVGLELDECYVSNATLAKPAAKGDKGLVEEFPHAVPSCLPRLEAEIAAAQPRVILTVGAAALVAVTGYDKDVTHQVRFDCSRCNPATRKVGPVIECNAPVPNPADGGETATKCGHLHFLRVAPGTTDIDPHEVELIKARGCEKCGAKLKRVQPKMAKCPACQGRKTRPEVEHLFLQTHKLKNVAGAIFVPAEAGQPPKPYEIDSSFTALGVRYFVPTYHPAFLLRDQQFMAKPVQHHLARAKRLLTDDVDFQLRYEVTKDPSRVREFTETPEGKTPLVFTVDIETEAVAEDGTRLDATHIPSVTKIKCVGIGTWSKGCLVVDTRDVDPKNDNDELLNALQDFLEDVTVPKAYHNGLYDIPVMHRVWWLDEKKLVESYSDDTLGAHALLYPDEPHDLGHVTLDLVDTRAWKPAKREKNQEVHESFEELCEYNARDVMNTDAAREVMGVSRGKADPGGKVYRARLGECYAIDSKIRRIALEMTLAGMPINREKWAAIGEEADREVETAKATCKTLLAEHTKVDPETWNPFATRQLGEVLFSRDGFALPASAFTATEQYSTDAVTLRRLRDAEKDRNPDGVAFLGALLDLREAHKTRATYVYSDAMQPWADGRIHPLWKPWGARTGRLSSSPNCQNWPKWLRSAVEAPPGRVFVGADFDQLELRIQAALSGDEEMIRRCMAADDKRKLEPDYDIHSFVGSLAFGTIYTGLLLKDPTHDKTNVKCTCQTCKRKALRDLTKCLHPDTLVHTQQSLVSLREAAVGTQVRAPKGWTHIEALAERPAQETVHVVFHRGIVTCSRTHRWPLVDGRIVEAGALQRGDMICDVPKPIEPLDSYAYPTVALPGGAIRGVPRITIPLSHEWSYIAGLWCGDGSISGHGGRITHGDVAKTDQLGCHYNRWQEIIAEALTEVGFVPRKESRSIVIGDRHAMRLFGVLSLSTTPPLVGNAKDHVRSSRILRIPPWVRAAGRLAILHFLGGLFDTDGYASHRDSSLRVCTKDAVFAGQIAAVLQACGLDACIDPSWNKTYKRYYWTIRVPTSSALALGIYMRHPGKRARLRTRSPKAGHMIDRRNRVKLVVSAPTTALIDVQVAATDHIFLANGIPTKNSVIYGLGYGAGDARVAEQIYERGDYVGPPVTLEMVAHLRKTIFRTFPKLATYREDCIQRAREDGETRSAIYHRRRIFPLDDVSATEVLNYPIQSTGADIVNERTILLRERLADVDPTAFLFGQVHDWLGVETDEDKADTMAQLLTDTLTCEKSLVEGAPAMRFTATGVASRNWKDA